MNEEDRTIKRRILRVDTNIGRAIGIGFVFDPNYYLFISMGKYCIYFGLLTKYTHKDNA